MKEYQEPQNDLRPAVGNNLLIVNPPGDPYDELGILLQNFPSTISPIDGASCSKQVEYEIELRKDTDNRIKYILYAGGEVSQSRAGAGPIFPEDFIPLSLPDDVEVYFYNSFQGKFVFQWAQAHGLDPEHIHGVNGRSYSRPTKEHIIEIAYQGTDPEVVWLKHMVHCYVGAGLDKIPIPGGRTLRQFLFRDP